MEGWFFFFGLLPTLMKPQCWPKHCLHSIYIDFPENHIDYQMFLPWVSSGLVTAGSNSFVAFTGAMKPFQYPGRWFVLDDTYETGLILYEFLQCKINGHTHPDLWFDVETPKAKEAFLALFLVLHLIPLKNLPTKMLCCGGFCLSSSQATTKDHWALQPQQSNPEPLTLS